jgi:hypothetical protein
MEFGDAIMTDQPKRIQRKRTKGWKMPENTVYVGRPTFWGNPWTVESAILSGLFQPCACPKVVVDCYRGWLSDHGTQTDLFPIYKKLEKQRAEILRRLPELRGKDLACWCKPGEPCHADVLIELANKEPS